MRVSSVVGLCLVGCAGSAGSERNPQSFQAILAQYDAAPPQARVAMTAALDAEAGAKDSATSRLFWFTDWAQAQAAAKASGKRIVALRLLGNLTDELSCANSRFFRTVLYPDPAVNAVLRDDYVLFWSSERPAPRLTIDFGDGRVVNRTITGNSLHAVLDAEGNVLDVMPGLVSAPQFVKWLTEAPGSVSAMRVHHEQVVAEADAFFDSRGLERPQLVAELAPNAARAMRLAMTKAAVEVPAVVALMPDDPAADFGSKQRWRDFARPYEARLSAQSVAAVKAKSPMNWASGRAEPMSAEGLVAMVRALEKSIALDTAKNLLVLRPAVSQWLLQGSNRSFEALNAWVYATVFRTPKNDPWLGLVPAGVFSAIERDGIETK